MTSGTRKSLAKIHEHSQRWAEAVRSWPALEGAPASIANDYTLVIKVMILTDLMRAHQETKQLIAQASRAYRKALERTSNDTRAVPALNQEYEPSPA